MAALPPNIAPNLPNKPLKSWTSRDIVGCIQTIPALADSVDAVRSALTRHQINGAALERSTLSSAILEEMFSRRLQRRKFLAEVQKWKMMRSKIIHVRTSTGAHFNLTEDIPPNITLNMPMTRVRRVIEDFLNIPHNMCALMDTQGRHLADSQESTLTLNNISWGCEIFVDVSPTQVPDEKDGIERTDAPDMITKEDDPRYPRARMPCSRGDLLDTLRLFVRQGRRDPEEMWNHVNRPKGDHGMTAMSMKLHVQDSLRRFQFEVFCPDASCRMLWDWDLCLKIAQFDVLEIDRLNRMRDANRAAAIDTVKICPNESCATPISKGNLRSDRVRCPGCSQQDICWRCLKPWKGSFGKACGNQGCDTELLQTCEIHELSAKEKKDHPDFPEFPVARSCPRCETIVIHREQCKHVHCSRCSLQFCMSCLVPRGKNGAWTCGNPFGPCPTGVAER